MTGPNTEVSAPKALLENLRRPGGGIKEAWALVQAGKTSVPVLLGAIEDAEPRVRGLICLSLGELGVASDEVIRALRLRLDDDDHEVRYVAARALGSLKTIPADVQDRLELMRQTDPNSAARDGAGEALLAITGNPPAPLRKIDELLRELKSANPQQREEAVDEIGRLGIVKPEIGGQEHVLRALTDRLLKDDYFQSRSSAALSLWRIGRSPTFVIDALTKALEDRDLLVRAMAVQILGNFGPKSAAALPKLKSFADDPKNAAAAGAAKTAIEKISPQ